MQILISGGLGYLGSHLTRFLSDELGHRLRVLARAVPAYFENWRDKYEIIPGDVTDKNQLADCCQGCDVVLQLAALDRDEARLDPEMALRVSAMGTRNLLEEAVRSHVSRFIFFSTFQVYGSPGEARLNENTPVNLLSDYSLAHYAGELYCRQFKELFGVNALRVRLTNAYGAPLHKNINCWTLAVQEFCLSAFREQRIVLRSEGTQRRDFISIPEILQAVHRLVAADPADLRHDLFNLGSGLGRSILDLAHRVKSVHERLYGQEVKVELTPQGASPKTQPSLVADIKRIKALGFRPDPPEAIDREIEKIFRLLGEP